MNLYEIGYEILKCIDEETGEVLQEELLQQLENKEKETLNNIGLWIKNLQAESQALKDEMDRLKKRRETAENKINNLKLYLKSYLNGRKFKSELITISYRKSESVKVDPNFIEWAKINRIDLLKYEEPKANKTKIKECLMCGEEIAYVDIEETNNINIK